MQKVGISMQLSLSRSWLELATGLSAIAAGVLWSWVWMLQMTAASAVEICGQQPGLGHCPVCLPATAATLGAVIGALLLRTTRGLDRAMDDCRFSVALPAGKG